MGFLSFRNGQGYEGNEGHGCHEGHESHEEKAVSKIAKGKMAKSVVFRGTKAKTVGGLTKTDLVENKRGKIVSKKSLAHGKKMYANIKAWTAAVQKARKALNVKGFVAVKKGYA